MNNTITNELNTIKTINNFYYSIILSFLDLNKNKQIQLDPVYIQYIKIVNTIENFVPNIDITIIDRQYNILNHINKNRNIH